MDEKVIPPEETSGTGVMMVSFGGLIMRRGESVGAVEGLVGWW